MALVKCFPFAKRTLHDVSGKILCQKDVAWQLWHSVFHLSKRTSWHAWHPRQTAFHLSKGRHDILAKRFPFVKRTSGQFRKSASFLSNGHQDISGKEFSMCLKDIILRCPAWIPAVRTFWSEENISNVFGRLFFWGKITTTDQQYESSERERVKRDCSRHSLWTTSLPCDQVEHGVSDLKLIRF